MQTVRMCGQKVGVTMCVPCLSLFASAKQPGRLPQNYAERVEFSMNNGRTTEMGRASSFRPGASDLSPDSETRKQLLGP